jgi:hypothetical protein
LVLEDESDGAFGIVYICRRTCSGLYLIGESKFPKINIIQGVGDLWRILEKYKILFFVPRTII